MEVNNWCNSSNHKKLHWVTKNSTRRGYYVVAFGSKTPRWRVLWRKLMREQKRIFDCSTADAVRVRVPYDPYTYLQNFDQGSMWNDPDNVSRSFSARFAVPSRIFDSRLEK